MKKIIILIVIIIILALAWYLISPIFRVEVADDALPEAIVNDSLDSMTAEERQAFDVVVLEMREVILEMNEEMADDATNSLEGLFKPRAHEVEGVAKIINHDGKRILRFEDFDTINGPNLHIYLSSDLGVGDAIDLGKIKATKGNVNYDISNDIDLEKYNKVLVWCQPFRVLFSYAELK